MKFSYSIPLIGSVEIELKDYPQKFYYFLKRKGEIKRLERLDHLGVLHNVFAEIRHTRWDYTITMLYLIQQFSESKMEGLSASKRINGLKLSGRDMMQLLALAANIGHLPGTFGVEKGVMRYRGGEKGSGLAFCYNQTNLKRFLHYTWKWGKGAS